MAGNSLIDDYLAAFDRDVRLRADRADLCAEVADHLHSTADALCAAGTSREQAEREALARFGEPRLVAALICVVPSKGHTVSVTASRWLPWLSAVAGVFWLSVAATGAYGIRYPYFTWNDSAYLWVSAQLALTILVSTIGCVAANIRARGGVDDATRAIGLIGALGGGMAFFTLWNAPVWLTLLAIVVVFTVVRTWRARLASPATVFTAVLALSAAAAMVAADTMGFSHRAVPWVLGAALGLGLAAWYIDIAIRARRPRAVSRVIIA